MRKLFLAIIPAMILTILLIGQPTSAQTPPPGPVGTIGPPPPPPPPPGLTPTVTPLTLTVSLAHSTVHPPSKQKISVTTAPAASVSITVRFPNRQAKHRKAAANSAGKLSWSYVQYGSKFTRASHKARVTVQATMGGIKKQVKKGYTIAFAPVDVLVQPRTQGRGKAINIWLHATGHPKSVSVRLSFGGSRAISLANRVSANGWAYWHYVIPRNVRKGSVIIRGWAFFNSKGPATGATTLRVK